jgi:hypothetical protein
LWPADKNFIKYVRPSKKSEKDLNDEEKPEQIFNLDKEIDSLFKIVANMKTGTPSNSDEEEI